MDSIPSYEFHKIFNRVSLDVPLTGCNTATAISNSLRIARHKAKNNAKKETTRSARKYWFFKAEEQDKLLEHDFAGRVMFEANRKPKGFIALSLIYGRKTAKQKINAQKRASARRPILDYSKAKRMPELRRRSRRWYQ